MNGFDVYSSWAYSKLKIELDRVKLENAELRAERDRLADELRKRWAGEK